MNFHPDLLITQKIEYKLYLSFKVLLLETIYLKGNRNDINMLIGTSKVLIESKKIISV